MTTTVSMIDEMVPLAYRLLCMQVVRVVTALAVVAYILAAPGSVPVGAATAVAGTAAYAAAAGLVHAVWHVWGRRNITLFGALLITDGFFLCWATLVTGGSASPLRWLAVLHVMAVALLASYRTAAKLALWHSLLAILALRLIETGHAPLLLGVPVPPPGERLATVCFIVATWLAAVGTASFAATNERELRRRKLDLEDLARMATAMEHAAVPAEVARTLRDSLMEAYAFSRLEVVSVGPDGVYDIDGGRPVASTGLDAVLRDAFDSHATQLVARLDPAGDPLLSRLLPDARNLVVVPLFADGEAIGAVVAEHGLRRGSRVERRVVAMVERFCAHAALALRNAWLLDEVRKVAATDGLTGLANRRTFEQALAQEVSRARRSEEPFSLVMLDIDYFKRLNDMYGHRTGDEALRAVAAVLADTAREMDVVARYGGEEFGVIVPAAGSAAAAAMADRLRAAVAAAPVEPPVTVSVGVATYPRDAADAEALVRAADAALYEAKARGRNAVVVSGEPAPADPRG